MVDRPLRVVEPVLDDAAPATSDNFGNVEFLDSSLADPTNVLRAKLKDVAELPESVHVRRILVITELVTEDGRGLDVLWSESGDEPFYVVQDSVVSMLTRVKSAITGSGE